MFPIRDRNDRTIGFGGRALDESLPKYLNSPETPVFHKGRVLFGLPSAREACRQHGEVLVVEGYFDLLALYGQGIRQVVAPLGTAVTAHHVRLLNRLAPRAVLVFDGDEAGMNAAMRSLELFLRERLPVRLLSLPEGMDPDDFLQREGKEAFLRRLREASPLLDVFLEQSLAQDDGSVSGRAGVVRAVAPVIKLLDSGVTREAYLRMLSQRLAVSEEALCEELGPAAGRAGVKARHQRQARPDRTRVPTMEEVVVRILVHHPEWIAALEETGAVEHFSEGTWQQVARLLLRYGTAGGAFDLASLLLELQNEELRRVITAWSLEVSPWSTDVAHLRLQEYLTGIKERGRGHKDALKRLQREIQAAEQNQDEQLLKTLLARKAALVAGKANGNENLSKGERV
jgi:DNA primase